MTVAEIVDQPIALDVPKEITDVATVEELKAAAQPFFDDAAPLCETARQIVVTDEKDRDGMKKAADTRKSIKRIRVDADKVRKTLKEDSLRKGQAIDKIFNGLRDALSQHEKYLEDQEKFAERIAAERKATLKAERDADIAKLGADPSLYNTGDMTDETFAATVDGIKAKTEADRMAAEKIEQERIAKEKAEAEERKRIEAENARLKAEAEERDRKAAEERAAAEARERAEREAREKAEAELREREESELRKVEEERIEAEKAEQAPDKLKLKGVAQKIRELRIFEPSSKKGVKVFKDVASRTLELADWIDAEADKL